MRTKLCRHIFLSLISAKLSNKIYILSGLGADERVFQKLDFSGFDVTFVHWIVPLDKETIEEYAKRLLNQIPTEKPILVGLSFGGIMAVEIAKLIATEKVILIASAKTKSEIPFYFRLAGKLRLHKLVPTALLKSSNFMTNWLFGASTLEDKQLLKQIMIDADPIFLKWAIDKVARWKNVTQTRNILHIHGTIDKILPSRYVNTDIQVPNGGHLMTLNMAVDLTKILRQQLSQFK